MQLLKNLNPEQHKAATFKEGPLLIVAGAGTGKTTVITQRISHLINSKRAKSDEILALTFTDKASQEMQERLDMILPYGYVDMWIYTFHSFSQRILESYGIDIGLSNAFKLLNQTEQWILLHNNISRLKLDYYRPLGNPTKFLHALLKHFSRLKDEAITPKEYLEYAEGLRLNSDSAHFLSQILSEDERDKLIEKEVRELKAQEIKKAQEVADAYHAYQEFLLENNSLDFGDLIHYCLKLFRERPKIIAKFRSQFKYILVDEFQDTNWAQYELIKLLSAPKNNLTVCGDDDQCLPPDTKIFTREGIQLIKNIKKGNLVASAVGKGYISYFPVSRVFKNKKKARFISFVTEKGYKITVTDNHKMFCLVPAIDDRKYHYVYLMQRKNLGWRLGVTCDLAARLRLERSADRIIGIKMCFKEEEARFYEIFYSLKYNIPTTCFKPRDGAVIAGEWLTKLFQVIDTEKNVQNLARDLNIDLKSHHASLGAVKRGDSLRLKILLEMCHRSNRSKYAHGGVLANPYIKHLLSLETSDSAIIKKLKIAGFDLRKSKKNGWRLRIESKDLLELGKKASQLEEITQGIVEVSFKAGKTFIQTRKSLCVPAKNVLVGHYLPVLTKEGIIYDRIVTRTDKKERVITVYDLEVSPTHNFIANGVIVHNSIYKFRGASVSNILQFKKDFPNAEQVYLIKNYRSCQNILDLSYNFIQHNNPNRLEVTLNNEKNFSKKLIAQNTASAIIEYLELATHEDEMKAVISKILELKTNNADVLWSDFAILVRANSHADIFNYGLSQKNIPYQYVASRGLYNKPIILDMLSYLKLLDNYHESPALFRIVSLPIFQFTQRELINFNYWAKRKGRSLYQILSRAQTLEGINEETVKKAQRVINIIEKHTKMIGEKSVKELLLLFLEESGYLKEITRVESQKAQLSLSYLNQFYRKISEYEAKTHDPNVKNFLHIMELEIEAGEEGSLDTEPEVEGPDSVKVMTVHAAKGLEFKYVFIANLVDRRFPTTERKEPIEIPNALVKEIIPTGDIHLQEERRLMYVACTRAKIGLYLTGAKNYGGTQKKKPSVFIKEMGLLKHVILNGAKRSEESHGFSKGFLGAVPQNDTNPKERYKMPERFSFSQLKAYENCPWQYRYAFILRVPVKGKPQFSFGKTIHLVMQKMFERIRSRQDFMQGDLFGTQEKSEKNEKAVKEYIRLDEVVKIYQECFIDDWYRDEAEKNSFYEKGKKILKEYYTEIENEIIKPKHLEKSFSIKISDNTKGSQYSLFGVIDRIDEKDGGLEIVDYKTGKGKKALQLDDKEQLLIYQMACQEIFQKPVKSLTFLYVEENLKQTFIGAQKDLDKLKEKIISAIHEIEKGEFKPKPGIICKYCDFRDICEFRAL